MRRWNLTQKYSEFDPKPEKYIICYDILSELCSFGNDHDFL